MGNLKTIYFGHNPMYMEAIMASSNLTAVFMHKGKGGLEKRTQATLELCKQNNVSAFFKALLDFKAISIITDIKPDIILCGEYHLILKDDVISIPRLACLNIHGSLLPKYRGVHPVNWMIVNGEEVGGVTIHFVDKGVDTGLILSQKSFPISEYDTAFNVRQKIEQHACMLIKETLLKFEKCEKINAREQIESEASYFPARTPEDGIIHWDKSAYEIRNLIRAVTKPYPGAFTYYFGKKITIWKSEYVSGIVNRSHGLVTESCNDCMIITTSNGNIKVTDWEPKDIIPKMGEKLGL